eukprot:TRINITY_DN8051_c0_g1_i1.p1 TRINITY_DN8051_c0_g1~~TRINITY_DN8051_c0_g1_i1.p1  ORF type:complete len:543 (-),score=109.53 TRINITY_DN8051_c0_g1_i1:82-1710(-)
MSAVGQQKRKPKSRTNYELPHDLEGKLGPETKEKLAKEKLYRDEIISTLRTMERSEDLRFEAQMKLVNENVTERDFIILCSDLTEPHYADVEEERYLSGKCGFPMCHNSINPQKPLDVPMSEQMEIGFRNLKNTNYFCSVACLRNSLQVRQSARLNKNNLLDIQGFLDSIKSKVNEGMSSKKSPAKKQTSSDPQKAPKAVVEPSLKESTKVSGQTMAISESILVQEKETQPPSMDFSNADEMQVENYKSARIPTKPSKESVESHAHMTGVVDTRKLPDQKKVHFEARSQTPSGSSFQETSRQSDKKLSMSESPSFIATLNPPQSKADAPSGTKSTAPAIIVRPMSCVSHKEGYQSLFRLQLSTVLTIEGLLRQWKTEKTLIFWRGLVDSNTSGGIHEDSERMGKTGLSTKKSSTRASQDEELMRLPPVDSVSKSRKRKDALMSFLEPLFPYAIQTLEIADHQLLWKLILELVETFDMKFGLPPLKNHHHLAFMLLFVHCIGRQLPSVSASLEKCKADVKDLVEACMMKEVEFEELVRDAIFV